MPVTNDPLVGSVSRPQDGWGVEDVLRNCGTKLGNHVSMLPDGEVGDRYYWINYVARHTYSKHPDMMTVSRHSFEEWKPESYDDHWKFTIKEGVEELYFDEIGYAAEAKNSYQVFRKLREEGTIPESTRFMVALPLIESATRPFIDTGPNFEILWRAYGEAISREIEEIVDSIPHEDLAIQWDICLEVAAVEGIEVNWGVGDLEPGELGIPLDAMERYRQALSWLCPKIPEDVWLGLHICYGSLGHQQGENSDTGHFKPIENLNISVDMANEGVGAAGRSVQYVHMAVQFSNGFNDSYYQPLERLDIGETRVYLGLVHLQDGVDGALRRVEIAKKYISDFGIATQCGWGRLPEDQRIEDMLQLEKEVAEAAF